MATLYYELNVISIFRFTDFSPKLPCLSSPLKFSCHMITYLRDIKNLNLKTDSPTVIKVIRIADIGNLDENTLSKVFSMQKHFGQSQQFPYHIIDDGVKWLMVPSKIILEVLCEWPQRQNKFTAAVNIFFISSYFSVIIAQFVYIMDKNTDIGSAVDAITGFISSFEAVGRRILSVVLAKSISKILSTIYYDFWPSDIAGRDLHFKIKKRTWFLVVACFYEAAAGFAWTWQCVLKVALHKLPLSSKFWFPSQQSPFYEVLYVWQSLICFDLVANISTLDFFLLSLMLVCVSQFRLLRLYVETEFVKVIEGARTDPDGGSSKARSLMLKCITQHKCLVNTCKEMEKMLTIFILVLYMGTVGTVCLSSFLLTVVKQEMGKAIPYFSGHMMQTFHYCYIGHELIFESTALADAVARCGWHLLPYDKDLQKSLVLVMARSQRPITMTMGGFGILSLASYMKLIQFCFSVYTVLSSTVGRSQ